MSITFFPANVVSLLMQNLLPSGLKGFEQWGFWQICITWDDSEFMVYGSQS
nr:hypothetical protein [Nostoc sp. T09]